MNGSVKPCLQVGSMVNHLFKEMYLGTLMLYRELFVRFSLSLILFKLSCWLMGVTTINCSCYSSLYGLEWQVCDCECEFKFPHFSWLSSFKGWKRVCFECLRGNFRFVFLLWVLSKKTLFVFQSKSLFYAFHLDIIISSCSWWVLVTLCGWLKSLSRWQGKTKL